MPRRRVIDRLFSYDHVEDILAGLDKEAMSGSGDAGWAGLVAEASADGSNRPMYVIFPQGEDVLPLVNEALSLLSKEKAWGTSFSTYFTRLPAGVDCLWRFVLDGSPEAQQARSASHSRTIDLVELRKSRRSAPDHNPYVAAARSGRPVEPAASVPRVAAQSGATLVIINREQTPLDDLAGLVIREPIGAVLEAAVGALGPPSSP